MSWFWHLVGYGLCGLVMYWAFRLAYDNSRILGLKKVLINGLIWCGGLAIWAALTVGQHVETDDYDDDPIFGRGHTVQDFIPTNKQRIAAFARVFAMLYIPVVIGGVVSRRKQKEEG